MTQREHQPKSPAVAIIGGGLAGLAAAEAASRCGLRVELFEARRQLGGRAGSFRDSQTGQLVDHCQHLALGCCTNLAEFCRRTRIADCFGRHRRLHFFGPRGTRHDVAAAGWLPAPLHLAPGLLRLGFLTLRQRLAIARTLGRLAREPGAGASGSSQTIGDWLRQQGQSEPAIERFWSIIVASALSETVDRASLAAARKVFCDGFLASRRAYELLLPQFPLREIYGRRVAAYLAEQGVAVHTAARIKQIAGDALRAGAVVLRDGTRLPFDFVVVAVPWHRVGRLFAPAMLEALPELQGIENIQPAPITAVHLWLDRPITPLPHAVLVGRTSQWVFCKGVWNHFSPSSSAPPTGSQGKMVPDPFGKHYYQIVISASHDLAGRERREVVAEVCDDLAATWPAAGRARLVHWRMVTQPAAVFSMQPGTERYRPSQQTSIPNLMLAGDWTATGWPATMEGAVRSGYLAVEAILKALGQKRRLVVSDLPRTALVRWLLGAEENAER